MPTPERSLRDSEHPYYCSESNYFNNDCGENYGSWADFYESMGSMDDDLNLLFRWDWTGSTLSMFWVLQRKGIFMCTEVTVTPDDEPAIREFLERKWAKLREMWEPIR